jgi:hypothetical protein
MSGLRTAGTSATTTHQRMARRGLQAAIAQVASCAAVAGSLFPSTSPQRPATGTPTPSGANFMVSGSPGRLRLKPVGGPGRNLIYSESDVLNTYRVWLVERRDLRDARNVQADLSPPRYHRHHAKQTQTQFTMMHHARDSQPSSHSSMPGADMS